MKIFQTNPWKLEYLLQLIDNGAIVLPEFQRDFVWYPKNSWELLLSLSRSFPAGSLLFLRYSKNVFACRLFDCVEKSKGENMPAQLVLDGQQRLTSLYHIFMGKGEHRFWIDIKALREGQPFEGALNYDRAERFTRRVKSIEEQFKKEILPLSVLFGESIRLDRWISDFIDYRKSNGEDFKDEIWDIRDKYLKPMLEYEFPVVELTENTDLEAVCLIFETLNTAGIRLTVFELLTARYWPLNINLRQLWEEATDSYPILQEFEIDPVTILQIVALLSNEKSPACKRKQLLNLDGKVLQELWPIATKSLSVALHILRNECGVISPKWLPYSTILPALSATIAKIDHLTGPERGAALTKLKRWFWSSIFSQRYESATDEKNAQDFIQLVKWIQEKEQPEVIKEFSFGLGQLKSISRQRNAVYRGVFCLLIRDGVLDFHTGQKITTQLIIEENIEDHHIFPKKYLERKKFDADMINCILNRTLIDGKTNRTISDKAPSKYLKEMDTALGEQKLKEILESHLLLLPNDALFQKDDFSAFLKEREVTIYKKIEESTS